MFQNYLNSALRNLWKSKLYAAINIGGLALGLAVAILIVLFVQNELRYDQWLPAKDQLYRVYRQWGSGGATVWTPDPLAEQLSADFPEVEYAAGLSSQGETMLEYQNNKLYIEDVALVDSTFFQVFALPFQYGRIVHALKEPNAVVISQNIAEKFFGPVDPIGETLRLNDERDLVITGVMAPLENTHLPYEVYTRYTRQRPNWNSNNRATYLKINPNTELVGFEEKMTEVVNEFKAQQWREIGVEPGPDQLPDWHLQAVPDIHLYSADIGWMGRKNGDIKYVYIFVLIAFIVLLIGSINYINLSTARSVGRAREVGVRKVTGANRRQLITQFLVETVVQAVFALMIAVLLVELFLSGFNQIVDRELAFLGGEWLPLSLPLVGLTVAIGLLAGIYPAFVMSAFRPVKVLKGLIRGTGGVIFRRGLVVTQFSLSIVLVIVMLFIYKQITFMMDKELGFAGDQVMVIPFNDSESYQKLEGMREVFLNISGVTNITTASRMPGHGYPDWSLEIEGQDDLTYPRVLFADQHYEDVLGIEVVEGRFFSLDHPSDSANAFVVNEAFVKENQLKDPLSAKIKFSGDTVYSRIIGVVKDYHFQSLDREIRSLLIGPASRNYYAGLKLSTNDFPATISAVEKLWLQVEPSHPMRYSFLDEDFASLYEEYERFGKALLYATALAILIAILGLFGLATYSALTRTKEIGVRKILGATVRQLSLMLLSSFIRWVLIAGIIAAPLAYLISSRWLENFAYRTEISALPFVAAIVFTILIAALTVGFQALKAATRNPVEALRYE